jgi:hypothetical protein
MSQNSEKLNNEYDSLKDVTEFQNNMYNPGHYIGTGKVPPTVTAPGNAMPMVIMYFFGIVFCVAFALIVLYSDSDIADKIILVLIMLGISGLFAILGVKYLKKTKRYYKDKKALNQEEIIDETSDELWQRTCPKCGEKHDIDYPKCPKCKYNYLD